MNFDEMVELINSMKKSSNEEEDCMICHLPIEKNIMKLKCGHKYHEDCIEFIKNKKQSIVCPYCQVVTDISKVNKIKTDISVETTENTQVVTDIITENSQCNIIIKSGKNVGKKCNKINCIRHKTTIQNLCPTILKTGKNKGTQCNRLNCKIHFILNV
jgi:hypothetical protein